MSKPLVQATGRRKESVARVRLRDGSGQVTLNGRSLEDYFPTMATRMRVMEPLQITRPRDATTSTPPSRVEGAPARPTPSGSASPGPSIELDPELRPVLKKAGLLTRDARVVERKKYGLRKARRAPQYTKR
jgi:small subunit ribosomal protein S9